MVRGIPVGPGLAGFELSCAYVIAAPKRKHATASGASDSGAPTCSAVSGPMEVRSVDELRVHAQHRSSRTRFWISPIVLRSSKCVLDRHITVKFCHLGACT